ncbi:alpha-D-xyloside xylohydrolase [Microbacterium endophyticum]|uniref:alpha-D-xyloside xylohydrolase n=1 Tax=Microbacterium endophyticum TaxID=1526412 RepID=A0A7W4V5B3_9MICO|nr:alpha-xylosidase [Microbacterium endophyticum]MBB2976503.1 alpha-D-xyloside xylohydrolase [Microbacterium endophyticum]NIK35949.1 alpha-D-xyloside xylohydrolase [Microbacterium endophyticum]
MKFTDGFWALRPGVNVLYAQEAYDLCLGADNTVQITAPTKVIAGRGDTLNRPSLSVTLSAPLPGVVGVRVEHHQGARNRGGFGLPGADFGHAEVVIDDSGARVVSGDLTAHVDRGAPWSLRFTQDGKELTRSGEKSVGYAEVASDAHVEPEQIAETGRLRPRGTKNYLHEQLSLGVGEHIYGFGERFGPMVKNGQTIDIWNADGGTSSEQSYKNVPFYISDRGYGVFVDDPGHVSFEVGTESVERVQFSVSGEALQYYVIAGDPQTVLDRYTQLTGRPSRVPAWSYGLWLSTSFTTDYDEATVSRFIDGMAERDIPLSVFHFDCFWMREFNWSDFEWDSRVFPDPEGMLARLHEKGVRVCVWINPYIAQRSPLFAEAREHGYFVTRPDGSLWQWDMWQAGMALVDFTNPDAVAWYQSKLKALLDQGVDCFKTDFGERIPTDVRYFDDRDPEAMHNLYAQRYNEAVFDLLENYRGEGEAVVFARAATAGGQRMPVHWGGDSTSTYESMAETLRGGLSLAMSGFGFWSHDIGGFEGTPDAGVFKRWVAFGLLSSHSRLHGSDSYRVPWAFDDEAVEITRYFTRLKLSLMPMLYAAGEAAHERGLPVMRPMALAFPDEPAVSYLDAQYMLGDDLLVAPVFSATGDVSFYLPEGGWTHLISGERVAGGRWIREQHGYASLPLYVRDGAVLARGGRDDRPDYDYLDGLVLELYPTAESGRRDVVVTTPEGTRGQFEVIWSDGKANVSADVDTEWSLRVRTSSGVYTALSSEGKAEVSWA